MIITHKIEVNTEDLVSVIKILTNDKRLTKPPKVTTEGPSVFITFETSEELKQKSKRILLTEVLNNER